jgi:hypothetical protein
LPYTYNLLTFSLKSQLRLGYSLSAEKKQREPGMEVDIYNPSIREIAARGA